MSCIRKEYPINELDLFQSEFIQSSIISRKYENITAEVDYKEGLLPMTFDFGISENEYIDLSDIKLYIKCKIVAKADKKLLTGDKKVGPVNNFLHSIIGQVDVTMNQKLIKSHTNYPYQAYIENLLNFGSESKNTHLASELFIKDTAAQFESSQLRLLKTETSTGILNNVDESSMDVEFNPISTDSNEETTKIQPSINDQTEQTISNLTKIVKPINMFFWCLSIFLSIFSK